MNKLERINDYNKNPKRCKCCNEIIDYKNRINSFCNSSCSATYNNNKRVLLKSTKNKISESLKNYYNIEKFITKTCITCNNEFIVENTSNNKRKKTCSKECTDKYLSKIRSNNIQERIKKGTFNGWQTRNITSYPEKFFIKILKNNNLFDECEVNYLISKRKLGLNEEGNYFLDFYFKNKQIDLEIDGSQHEYRKEHDNKRDSIILLNGITVYRIKWKSINSDNGKKYITEEIQKFLNFYNKK